jgi:hypothetical protein
MSQMSQMSQLTAGLEERLLDAGMVRSAGVVPASDHWRRDSRRGRRLRRALPQIVANLLTTMRDRT